MPTNKDVIHAIISDVHSGSNYALFLDRFWQGLKEQNHSPTATQLKIAEHKNRYCAEVKQARKGRKLKLIVDGDAIDGDHHASGDVCTTNEKEQAEIHIEIMVDIQKRMDWQRGDELYYVKGTPVHVGGWENAIAKDLNAIPQSKDYYAWDFLPLETNGVLTWFIHHGANAGEGANEGNGVRNFLKRIHEDAEKDGDKTPDIVWTGHVHSPTYQLYAYRKGMTFKAMHGGILPSWQTKTEYAWMKKPVSKNKIGGVYQLITADGLIDMPRFCVMEYK
jgi:hypothetical protein